MGWGRREVEVVNDSELVARQIGGQYKVKNAGLRPLWQEAMAELREFDSLVGAATCRARRTRARTSSSTRRSTRRARFASMATYEASATTSADAEAVWKLWTDVSTWADGDHMERPRLWVDESRAPGVRSRFEHVMSRAPRA